MNKSIKNKNAGKGDSRRPYNYKEYGVNYDQISWGDAIRTYNYKKYSDSGKEK